MGSFFSSMLWSAASPKLQTTRRRFGDWVLLEPGHLGFFSSSARKELKKQQRKDCRAILFDSAGACGGGPKCSSKVFL